ncbi:MAG: M15 family metallopeptidase [Hyphomicrobiales bacterium]
MLQRITFLLISLCLVDTAWANDAACTIQDFLKLELPSGSDMPTGSEDMTPLNIGLNSVLLAYPDLELDRENNQLISTSGKTFSAQKATGQPPKALLEQPSFADQFQYVYPLAFDLSAREDAWQDPGRIRNDDFMALVYFESEAAARATLTSLKSGSGTATFNVTVKNGVNCQLQAVLDEIGTRHKTFFSNVGGSFNWRKISGTNRLSVHSYGAAIDLNADLGDYWKWRGYKPGKVGKFNNKVPEELVRSFERYGFIWGGKWHHFDGMHFEYRPELILYARILEKAEITE